MAQPPLPHKEEAFADNLNLFLLNTDQLSLFRELLATYENGSGAVDAWPKIRTACRDIQGVRHPLSQMGRRAQHQHNKYPHKIHRDVPRRPSRRGKQVGRKSHQRGDNHIYIDGSHGVPHAPTVDGTWLSVTTSTPLSGI